MENTTQLFLAVRFNCNKCHDHPFERWTQDQYYNWRRSLPRSAARPIPSSPAQRSAARPSRAPCRSSRSISDQGRRSHARADRQGSPSRRSPKISWRRAPPRPLAREQLAQWITRKENPYFAKSYVNRIWSYLLGVGIIEPIDDIRAGNPPTNPELLDRLTAEFIDSRASTSSKLIRDDLQIAHLSAVDRHEQVEPGR